MADRMLQLINSSTVAHGNRYGAAEHESAYLRWVTTAGRSFAVVSEKTGIAENTLRQWAKADEWTQRAKRHDEEATELARVAVFSTVVNEFDRSIATLVELRDSAKNEKVRLDSALAILAVGGISTRQGTSTLTARVSQPAEPHAGLTSEQHDRFFRMVFGKGMNDDAADQDVQFLANVP